MPLEINVLPDPLPHQIRAFESTCPIVSLICGTGAGKTFIGPRWLVDRHSKDDRVDSVSLQISPTYKLAKKTAWREMDAVFRQIGKTSKRIEYKWNKTDHEFSLTFYARDGDVAKRWTCYAGTAEDPTTYEGVHATAAGWFDEVGMDSVSLHAFETAEKRMAMYAAQLMLTTTPYNTGWLKDKYEAFDPDWDVIRASSADNPYYSRKRIEAARRSLPDWKFRMYYLAEFTQSPLAIYPAFDREKHVRTLGDFKADTLIGGLDWGSTNPMALHIIARVGDTYRVVAEYYVVGGLSTEKYKGIADHVTAAEQRYQCKLFKLYVDPSAAQQIEDLKAGHKANEPDSADYRRKLPAVAADNAVVDGISTVETMFEHGRIEIDESCPNLIAEIPQYKWHEDRSGNVDDTRPVKVNDHCVDDFRYSMHTYGANPPQPGVVPRQPPKARARRRSRTAGPQY